MLAAVARAVDAASAWPGATVLALVLVILWLAAGPPMHFSAEWLTIAGAFTGVGPFVVAFAIQNSARRDTTAVQAKLDALILAVEAADNRLIGLERKPEVEVKAIRAEIVPPTE